MCNKVQNVYKRYEEYQITFEKLKKRLQKNEKNTHSKSAIKHMATM